MSEKIENPPAFPQHDTSTVVENYKDVTYRSQGMSLRDYAQIKAMQALITANYTIDQDGGRDVIFDFTDLVKEAGIYADEFLKDRND